MDEVKVRKAFDVADELAAKCTDAYAAVAFARVFDAMLYEPLLLPYPALTATGVDVMRGDTVRGQAMFCAHANEVPAQCPCDADCYCKTHTCSRTKSGRGE